VLSGELRGGLDELEGDKLEALLLEALDDLTNEATLDAVGLNSDEGALSLGTGGAVEGPNGGRMRTEGEGQRAGEGGQEGQHKIEQLHKVGKYEIFT
jgi:hypothetical protein